jgi:hypothetical protein
MTKIIGQIADGIKLDVKRFHMPGVSVEHTCSKCGKVNRFEVVDSVLSYPKIGENTIYSECEECFQEDKIVVLFNVTLQPATP